MAASQQGSRRSSPAPMVPFSLLANVTTTTTSASRLAATKRLLAEEGTDGDGSLLLAEEEEEAAAAAATPVVYKKPSRAAQREMVTCRECHAPFKLIIQLNQHMTREGHLYPPCPDCGVDFATLESLIGHADAHASETVFTCKYCQKGVLGFDRYLYHMLMCKSLIRGDYVCFICRKSFRNSGSLKTHLLLHTGAKPFPCNYCSASFRQRHHRSHHERSVHLQMQGGDAAAAAGAVESGALQTPSSDSSAAAAAGQGEAPGTPHQVNHFVFILSSLVQPVTVDVGDENFVTGRRHSDANESIYQIRSPQSYTAVCTVTRKMVRFVHFQK